MTKGLLFLALVTFGFITVVDSCFAEDAMDRESDIATLYKDSVVIRNARILIATFDSREKKYLGTTFDYNWENCITASILFMSQRDAKTRFWCEKGSYNR